MISIENILAALGIVSVPTGAGIKGYLSLRDRVGKIESRQESSHEVVLVKLDSIAEKIDLKCDAIEERVERIERKVLNGEYRHKD